MKIALIGCGVQAGKHIGGLRKCPDVEIVVVDKEPALARALAEREGVGWVEGVDQVFEDGGVTAVVLCVPTPAHAPLIRSALTAGKDFFCEKPLCETAVEANELDQLTARSRRIGMVGYVYRFVPVLQKVNTILTGARETGVSAVLGRIEAANMRIGGHGSRALWKHRRGEGGGALNEMMVHMLDLAIWCFGPLERAELVAGEQLQPRRFIAGRLESVDAEDFVIARLRTASGIRLMIEADLVSPVFTQHFQAYGDNGTVLASIRPEMPQFVLIDRPAGGFPAGRTEIDGERVDAFDAQMGAFVAALRSRRPHPGGTLADSVLVIEALAGLKGQSAARR